ncbi:MAG: DUF2628 domain-containing protein [Roseiarcus sp.]|jgi:hypothetical protein
MAIYAVHCPAGDGDPAAFERAKFLKLGFCWAAFVFGPIWLLAHRLWRPLALWLLGAALVGLALAGGVLGADGAVWLYALSAFYLGLEGRALQGAALARRGRPLADVVCAADSSTAEHGFFERRFAQPAPRGGPRANFGPPSSAPPEVLGLSPEASR